MPSSIETMAMAAGKQPIPQNEPFVLPNGIVPNLDTIHCPPHVSGYRLSGSGRGALNNKWNTGHATYLIRSGGKTTPVIRVTGSDHILSDFSIYGQDLYNITGIEPEVGILMAYDPAVGTGSSVFERLHVYFCKSAFKFGDKQTDLMCDTTTVRDNTIVGGEYAFHQVGGQAISNSFINNECDRVRKAVLRIEGGGNVTASGNSLIEISPGEQVAVWSFGPLSKYLGHNHYNYSDVNFKADHKCFDRLEYVHMDGPGGIGLTSINPQFGNPTRGNGKYTWYLHGGARIKVIGGSGLLTKHSIFVAPHVAGQYLGPPELNIEMHDQCCDPQDMVAPGSAPVRLTLHACYKPIGQGVQKRFNFYKVVSGANI